MNSQNFPSNNNVIYGTMGVTVQPGDKVLPASNALYEYASQPASLVEQRASAPLTTATGEEQHLQRIRFDTTATGTEAHVMLQGVPTATAMEIYQTTEGQPPLPSLPPGQPPAAAPVAQ